MVQEGVTWQDMSSTLATKEARGDDMGYNDFKQSIQGEGMTEIWAMNHLWVCCFAIVCEICYKVATVKRHLESEGG